jgi:hypothetical protein
MKNMRQLFLKEIANELGNTSDCGKKSIPETQVKLAHHSQASRTMAYGIFIIFRVHFAVSSNAKNFNN